MTETEINAYYDTRVAGAESEQALLDELDRLYGIDKTAYLANLSDDLLRGKVQASLDMPLGEWLESQQ